MSAPLWRYESDGSLTERTHYAVREAYYAPCGIERIDFSTAAAARKFVQDANAVALQREYLHRKQST